MIITEIEGVANDAWVGDVADSAVKIGLDVLITIVGGWSTLKLTHRHEIRIQAVAI